MSDDFEIKWHGEETGEYRFTEHYKAHVIGGGCLFESQWCGELFWAYYVYDYQLMEVATGHAATKELAMLICDTVYRSIRSESLAAIERRYYAA